MTKHLYRASVPADQLDQTLRDLSSCGVGGIEIDPVVASRLTPVGTLVGVSRIEFASADGAELGRYLSPDCIVTRLGEVVA